MFVIDAPRSLFQFLVTNKRYAEIGVYKGEYAKMALEWNPKHGFS